MSPADQVLDAKLALEREIAGPLYMVCRQYLRAGEMAGGTLPALERLGHQQRLEQLLRRHYARTVMVMSGRRPDKQVRLEEAAISLMHLEKLAGRAKNQSLMILAGVDRDLKAASMGSSMGNPMEPSMGDAMGGAKAADLDLEIKDKVRAGYTMRVQGWAKDAWSRLRNRIGAIANFETQGVAEEARFLLVQDQYASNRVMHQWNNMRDARVRHPPKSRFDHVSPGGQTVPVNQPFEVSGQLLRHPGDMSLGASIGNVISCRCYARYFITGSDGNEEDIYVTPSAPAWRRRRREGPGAGDNRPAYNPTTAVTLNGTTRARVILGSGEVATLRQERADLIVIRLRGDTIARARFAGGEITEISIAEGHRDKDIEGLIRRSVEHSAGRP